MQHKQNEPKKVAKKLGTKDENKDKSGTMQNRMKPRKRTKSALMWTSLEVV